MAKKDYLPVTLTFVDVKDPNDPDKSVNKTIDVMPDPAFLDGVFDGVEFRANDLNHHWLVKEKGGEVIVEIKLHENSEEWKCKATKDTTANPDAKWEYTVEVWEDDPKKLPVSSQPLAVRDPEIHWGKKG